VVGKQVCTRRGKCAAALLAKAGTEHMQRPCACLSVCLPQCRCSRGGGELPRRLVRLSSVPLLRLQLQRRRLRGCLLRRGVCAASQRSDRQIQIVAAIRMHFEPGGSQRRTP
jgi:hypothetical protein